MATDSGTRAHQEWLGLIQPVGLVVAPNALVAAQVELDRSLTAHWLAYDALLGTRDEERVLSDWPTFAREFLEWSPSQLAGATGGPALPAELTVVLPELDARLEPSYAVPDPHRDGQWLLLVRVEAQGVALDKALDGRGVLWSASPHDRFERLLRETGVAAGLLVSDDVIRFVYAPRGESSGWLSFPVGTMATPGGRPMLAALYELLKGWRLSRACPEERGLRRLLESSRKFQNEVSTRLAEQVLGGLYELGRGFQAADAAAAGVVLQGTLRDAPNEVYGGLLATIMRLVFVLYAEERGMLPQDAAWVEHYGVGSLLERLRQDKARYPDTMDQRYGAWPRLLSLFRILHDGASHETIAVPPRAGELFDPDRYPFLEGRPLGDRRVMDERLASVPRVSDGTVLRLLERLLMLDEERLSYRALDVEQIGSVYEAMMGFEVLAARGTSVAVKPKTRKPGSPSHPIVNLDALLAMPGGERAKWLKDNADCELPPADAAALRDARDVNGLLAALDRRCSPFTPLPIPLGGLVLSPTEERRRSGSHYTPRELTEPIVATTLRPVLEAFGGEPTPAQLLDLRICDPAMGSGAFLVGACRYLGDRLVEAWQRTGTTPAVPSGEDPQLFARRVVAQRCLFGVDRNPFAVQLAKLSLWLVTLAREHPFTFLDHALRCGDSLVGLTRAQIESFHWDLSKHASLWAKDVSARVQTAVERRRAIESLAETDDTCEKLRLLGEAEEALHFVRLVGDAAIAAFFAEDKPKKREAQRLQNEQVVVASVGAVLADRPLERITEAMRAEEPPIVPFHWEVEFAEVFERPNGGFDAIVGNPPFLGGKHIAVALSDRYRDYIKIAVCGIKGSADLVAYFFHRCVGLLRDGGAVGLLATKTATQGDTREVGLHELLRSGHTIYSARSAFEWPGDAGVHVVSLHIWRGARAPTPRIDDVDVAAINSWLRPGPEIDSPAKIPQPFRASSGTSILGEGFIISAEEYADYFRSDSRSSDVVRPFLNGEDFVSRSDRTASRFVIDFGDLSMQDASSYAGPFRRVVELVKPQRDRLTRQIHEACFWKHWDKRQELYRELQSLNRAVVFPLVSKYLLFDFVDLSTPVVFSHKLGIIPTNDAAYVALLQSQIHSVWVTAFTSSRGAGFNYSISDCLSTYPLSAPSRALREAAEQLLKSRDGVMQRLSEGLTTTYNRFHDPSERDPGILGLRELHDAIDCAVLDAYGWTDIRPTCEFLLDYEDDDESSRRRKPWRYRWPDDVRDEVLARLLDLNRQRATRPALAAQSSLF